MELYVYGLDELRDFTSDTIRFLLLQGSGRNHDHATVADVLAGNSEVTVSGYARQTAGSKSRTVSTTLDRIEYACADPDFSGMAAGEDVQAILVYKFITNDAGSIPIGIQVFGAAIPTENVTTLEIVDGLLAVTLWQ